MQLTCEPSLQLHTSAIYVNKICMSFNLIKDHLKTEAISIAIASLYIHQVHTCLFEVIHSQKLRFLIPQKQPVTLHLGTRYICNVYMCV